MVLETLYKRTKTGAIQSWNIAVEIANENDVDIVKRSGQLGGKITKHVEKIIEGKNIGRSNETTPLQQAESQAKSDWTKKHDDGYKSTKDLGIDPMATLAVNFTSILEKALPEFNTDANGEVKPQLAPSKPWVKDKTKYPQFLETKFDGNRTLCVIESQTKPAYFLSRSGKPITTLNHLLEPIQKFINKKPFAESQYPVIFDGEIYLHGLLLEEINEAVKKPNDNTLKLQFWVYDMPLSEGTQVQRSAHVATSCTLINHSSICHREPVVVNSDQEVIDLHDMWVQDGYEGAMLKDPKGTYQPGQRSKFWTKVKMFDDNEFIITGGKINKVPIQHRDSITLDDRTIDSFTFTCMSEGGQFDCKPGGSREMRKKYIKDLSFTIGKKLTVKHFGFTKYNIPNLPTGKCIRDEK